VSASGITWTRSTRKLYGYGHGRADPSVEHVACPVCGAGVGELCREPGGEPKLGRHYKRCDRYRAWGMSPKRRDQRCGMRGCRAFVTHVLVSHVGYNVEHQLLCCHGCSLLVRGALGRFRLFSATGRSR